MAVMGWDMGAVFVMGTALGVSAPAMAEFLPDIEQVAVRAINQRLEAEGD